MKFLISTLCIFMLHLNGLIAQETKALNIGEIQTFSSEILKENRELNIYLPQNYNTSHKYPVIYLLDGGMNEDFLHVVGLTQFYNLMYAMPEVIFLGIVNVDRQRDFTFQPTLEDLIKKYPTAGHSEDFIQFMEKELIPFMNTKYSTSPQRFLLGQSLGGLLATEVLWKKPDLFTHYIITSPSLWWNNESLLQEADKLIQEHQPNPEFIYISVGKSEGKMMINEAKDLFQKMKKSKMKSKNLHYAELTDVTHATILHTALMHAFGQLFKEKYP